MIINLATIDFNGGGGGGNAKPAVLQEKSIGITENGSQTVVPDEGYDGLSSVDINVAITGGSSAIDFSPIGYNADLSAELNAVWNNDVAYSKTLLDAWNPSNTSALRKYKSNTKLIYAPNIDTSNVENMNEMFYGCTSLTTVPAFNTSNVENMTGMFDGCTSLTSVPAFNTSNVTTVERMFQKCTSLTSVPSFDTSNVTNMWSMFNGCSGLTSVPAFDTSNVTNMWSMFNGCTSLTTIPEFDTSKVTTMDSMFRDCKSLTSVPSFDTSKVTDMGSMFQNCSGLTSVPAFDTSKVTDMGSMFSKCTALEVIPELDTSVCTQFSSIFWDLKLIKRIEGINFRAATNSSYSSYYFVTNTTNDAYIRYLLIKELGTQSSCTNIPAKVLSVWGVNTDEIPDARQSLIDSLITYSFDRAAAGYSTCTIALSTNTKALLTDDEKAQIVAKGYVIS